MRSILAFVVLLSAAAPARADALLERALANGGAYSPAEWAYTSTTQTWAGGSTVVGDAIDRARRGERARPPLREERVVRFDPSRPAGERQKVLYGKKSENVDVRVDEDDDLPAYAEMRQLVQGTPKLVAQTAASATYRFAVDASQVRKIGGADLQIDSDDPLPPLAGTAVVQKTGRFAPYVRSVVVALPTRGGKGRGNAVGKVKQLSFGFSFAPEPTRGVKLLRAFGMDSSLQGLGLVTVDFSLLNRVADYRFVGK